MSIRNDEVPQLLKQVVKLVESRQLDEAKKILSKIARHYRNARKSSTGLYTYEELNTHIYSYARLSDLFVRGKTDTITRELATFSNSLEYLAHNGWEDIAERMTSMLPATLRKPDWKIIKKVLKDNDIQCFYHFTSVSNIPSIIANGGLYAWKYCDEQGPTIIFPGGTEYSRNLDKRNGLENHVHLSFCKNHPMAYKLAQRTGEELVLLEIDTEVAYLQDTLFSNINAASYPENGLLFGPNLEDLERVNFQAVHFEKPRRGNFFFKEHQAEVLVPLHIPLKYILNIKDWQNHIIEFD